MQAPPCSGPVGNTTRRGALADADAFCRLGSDGRASVRTRSSRSFRSEHRTLDSTSSDPRIRAQGFLAADWALGPVELVRERGRTMLVVEYLGGEP